MSYTQFEISPVTLSDTTLAENGSLEATVTLTNKGTRRGTETVQLYIRDLTGSISRPVKELKGFEKVTLEPNESRQITFTVTPEILKFYNASLLYAVEQGDFNIYIGNSSATENKAAFTCKF